MMESVKKAIKILFAIVGVCGCLLATALYLKSDLLDIHDVQISQKASVQSGNLFSIIKEEMLPKLSSVYGESILGVDLGTLYERLQKDRRIKDVRISRSFPNRLNVVVEPHIPIANILSSRGDQVYPLTKEGSLFSPVSISESADAPILRGSAFLKDLERRKEALNLLNLFPNEGDFRLGDISEIHYDDRKGYILILNREANEVILGHKDFQRRIQHVSRVVQYLRSEKLKGRIIDARFSKKVVVRLRNSS